jgi:hypothetical protein
MVTRLEYNAIALAISKVEDEEIRTQLAVELGSFFAHQNPKFNITVWHSACSEGPDDSVVYYKPTQLPELPRDIARELWDSFREFGGES